MAGLIISLFLWFEWRGVPRKKTPLTPDPVYRAAIYSAPVDYLKALELFPEVHPFMGSCLTSKLSYKYFIQYGNNTLIEILHPGTGSQFNFVSIIKHDYANRKSNSTNYMEHARKYGTTRDTITYSIEESRGYVKSLCNETMMYERCDSVMYCTHSENREFKVFFHDTVTNLPSIELFYPDIAYLPYQITGLGYNRNTTITLEEIIYGKSAVDSLLQLFNYEGFDRITDKELNYIDPDFISELLKRLRQ